MWDNSIHSYYWHSEFGDHTYKTHSVYFDIRPPPQDKHPYSLYNLQVVWRNSSAVSNAGPALKEHCTWRNVEFDLSACEQRFYEVVCGPEGSWKNNDKATIKVIFDFGFRHTYFLSQKICTRTESMELETFGWLPKMPLNCIMANYPVIVLQSQDILTSAASILSSLSPVNRSSSWLYSTKSPEQTFKVLWKHHRWKRSIL